MGSMGERVENTAAEAADSRALTFAARGGFVMSGLMHLLIGWVALRIVWDGGGGSADQSGALRMIAHLPGGKVLLGAGGISMIALTIWFLLQAWFGARRTPGPAAAVWEVIRSVGKAVVYAALAVTALRFSMGGGADSSEQAESFTAGLMHSVGGRVAVLLLAAVVAGVGIGHVVIGVRRRFLRQLEDEGGRTVGAALRLSGIIGYVAKGVALIAVGTMIGWATVSADPQKSTGLDGALTTMAGLPAGRSALAVVGAGLVSFGIYCLFRARHEDM